MTKAFQKVHEVYEELKSDWNNRRAEWEDISSFVGITVDTEYEYRTGSFDERGDLDEYVDDPTAALSVNQAGDYLVGLMWGTGDNVIKLKPSVYVTELASEAELAEFYKFATSQALYHMNHEDAGLSTSMQPYAYDQMSFGTSGIGCFRNNDFLTGVSENALMFPHYGIDNTMIDEGKGGKVEIVFSVYNWRVNRIIGQFATTGGVVDEKKLAKLPDTIQKAYKNNNVNDKYKIVFGFMPREDYDPKLKGKRGTRYVGYWFMDQDNASKKPFKTEDFKTKPVAMARAIKVRGEKYGRASGTLLISSIRSVNYLVGLAIETSEKLTNPALGMFNNAIFGDSVLDTSPDGLTIFNQEMLGQSGDPAFPLYDVGNPSALIEFVVPYLNEKIATGFKVDALLDFNSQKDMTATESLQRYAIRGQSLSGFLLQQKNELLIPLVKRAVGILLSLGALGVDPEAEPERAQRLIRDRGAPERVIPEAVMQVIKSGKPWFEIEFNNELERLTRTQSLQDMLQLINAVTAIAALNPDIVEAIDWYKLLEDINSNLSEQNQILLSEKEFRARIEQKAQVMAAQMALAAQESGAKANKDAAQADKADAEAVNITSQKG